MLNKDYLNKAEALKPELIIKEITLPGSKRKLNDSDEIIFDFKNHYVGYISIDFSSVGHHQDAPLYFQIQFAEIEDELKQNVDDYHGWISKSWIQEEKIHVDTLPATYNFERRYACRYVKIKILATSDNYSVLINKITFKTVSSANYDNLISYKMSKKDKQLDNASIKTLHSCMQYVFEDGPKRDRRLWLGDLRLQALANYETFRNNDLVKRCLYLFASSTLEKGKLSSNVFTSPKVECDFQSMFDYALFFINTLWNYYENTDDLETLKDLEPVCLKQYQLLSKCFENDVIDLNKTDRVFVDWNFDLDKQVSAQAIYIYALKDLVKIEKTLNKSVTKIEKDIQNKSKAALKMFDDKLGLFVSGDNKQVSYASQIWMILAKVVDNKQGQVILKNVEKYRKAVQLNSPYAYHHYIQALIDVGLKDEAYNKMYEYWNGMIKKGSNTFWEIYNPVDISNSPYGGIVVHSFCHAWSCTPTYFLRKYFYNK